MADTYDLIVLGSGPGGYVAAIRAAQLGLKTAIVERENLGGICLNWGCIPTKALLRSAEIFHYMQHAKDYGLAAEKISADIEAVVKRSRGVAKQLNQGVTHLMKKNKITVHMGDGKLTGKGKLTVTNLLRDEIIDFTAQSARWVPHFHIPLQSGNNEVLGLMKRRYRRELYAERVARICSPDGENPAGIARLRQFYFDTALSSSPYALPALLAFADPTHITFGSDWPYAPKARSLHFANLLDQYPLGNAMRHAIHRGNAERLFPRLAR